MGQEEYHGEEAPLVTTLGPYQYNRTRKDTPWGVAFALFYGCIVAAGFYAYRHMNPVFFHIAQGYLDDPAHCPVHDGRLLAQISGGDLPPFDPKDFYAHAATWLAASVAGSLILGVVFLRAFQHLPEVMTRATVLTQVAAPLAVGAGMLGAGQGALALLPLGLAALSALMFYLWRGEIALAARLLGVSAHGLASNPHLVTTSVLLSTASVLAITPLLVTMGFAQMNGQVVVNPLRDLAAAAKPGHCLDHSGQSVTCCAWEVEPWAKATWGLGLATVLWTLLLANQIRVFVTSGAIAQWYFAPPGALRATRGTTWRALGHAMGPSFGSLSLASLVLTITSMLRSAADRNNQDNGSLASWVLSCIAQALAGLIEYLTKFATVFMAITGDAFMTAGRRVTDLLVRNFLDAFASTVWFTPMVISLAIFGASVGMGGAFGGLYYFFHGRGTAVEANLGLNASVVGVAAGLLAAVVLNFLGSLLLAVLDATFVCWAIDRDTQSMSHPEVAAVFETVPLKGAVVEQPGGGLAYGGLASEPPPQQRV